MQSMPIPTAMPAGMGSLPAATGSSPMMPTTPANGLEGVGQRIADALGSLLPSTGESGLPEPAELQPPALDEPVEEDASEDDETPTDDGVEEESDCRTSEDIPPTVPDAEPVESEAESEPVPEPAPAVEEAPPPLEEAPPPPVEAPAPPVETLPPPPADGSTPCEIAADELPQAGQ
jgi:hypothetical protein